MATKTDEKSKLDRFQHHRSASDPKPCLDSLSIPGDSSDGAAGDSSSWAAGSTTTPRPGKGKLMKE
ncbi:unnamed protein product, partial [Candidula unifasciata]